MESVESDMCLVPQSIWLRWTTEQTTEVLLIKLTQREITHTIVVGGYHTDNPNDIYLPDHCMIGLDEEEYCILSIETNMPPRATKITLQPLDTEAYHCDITAAVSEYLSNWNLLTNHITITVPIKELGGYLVDLFVKEIEPADTVLLRDEVPLELAEPLETFQERPPTPRPMEPEQILEPEGFSESMDFGSMISTTSTSHTMRETEATHSRAFTRFVAFSGQGRRLCDPS